LPAITLRPYSRLFYQTIEAATSKFAVEAAMALVHDPSEIEPVLAMLGREPGGGLIAYCIPGIMMGSYNWLRGRRSRGNTAVPTDNEVKNFLSGIGQTPPFGYLCRCGTHMRIIRAIQQAARG
jgi:aerobic-type carbon monoxide dehydrogenase small subunit (CoxS/CutS family)